MEEQTDIPPEVRTCLECDYILTGLASPGKCPECARAFDLKDPRSTGPNQHRTATSIATFSPSLWAFMPFVCILCVMLLIWSSPTGAVSEGPAAVIGLGTIGLAIVWSLSFLVSMLCRLAVLPRDGRFLRWLWRWWRFPLVVALAWYLQMNGVVWQARWWHAKEGFDALRASIEAGQPIPSTPFDIGTFTITSVKARVYNNGSDMVVFTLGWPDTAYSDMAPAIVTSPYPRVGGWPIDHTLGDNWFHCMDPT